jgi:hypothetical protein
MSMQVILRLPGLWPLFAAAAYSAGRSKQLGRLTSAQHQRQGRSPQPPTEHLEAECKDHRDGASPRVRCSMSR